MYRITLFGETPGTLGGLIVCMQETPELCKLEYFKMLSSEPERSPYHPPFIPLQAAPDGLYNIWHDAPSTRDGFFLVDLVITKRLWIIGETVIQRTGGTAGGLSLDKAVLKSFQSLLSTSNKELHVYQRGENGGDRRYLMEWPGELKDTEHYPNIPEYQYVGKANLDNGAIER